MSYHSSISANNNLRCFEPGLEREWVKGNGRGHWSKEYRKSHTNVLEMKAVKLAIMFTMPHQSGISIHLRLDSIVLLSYLLKVGGWKVRTRFQSARKSGITSCFAKLPLLQNTSQGWWNWKQTWNLEIWSIQSKWNYAQRYSKWFVRLVEHQTSTYLPQEYLTSFPNTCLGNQN